ncbi:MAG: ribosome-binding ATPase [Bacillota bacterium]|nr:ribosome-binding ATPase [Bacillota bacterium]MDK2856304.1 ribosome-binding ATPase [Bacillota bacterium]MDK2925598.1 ribosome-binding ATPase [Bacillota bacterium]
MKIGLVGLPLSGKTTFFNLLTGAGAATSAYAGQRESHIGMARVPDARVDFLSELFRPAKTTYAQIQVLDIPGLTPRGGAAEFAGLLRDADALVVILRGFTNPAAGISEEPEPMKDLSELMTELILTDLAVVERRLERLHKGKKAGSALPGEEEVLRAAKEALEREQPVVSLGLSPKERRPLKNYGLYTDKPFLIVLNTHGEGLRGGRAPGQEELTAYAHARHLPLLVVCAELEEEIEELPVEERAAFLADLGVGEPGVARLARAAYAHLDLISYFTVGSDEVKAWTIRRGTTAKQAAGKIHSDLERGFIRVEVVSYEDMVQERSFARLKEKGLLRLEGKDYVVQDGDIMNFRFNV